MGRLVSLEFFLVGTSFRYVVIGFIAVVVEGEDLVVLVLG